MKATSVGLKTLVRHTAPGRRTSYFASIPDRLPCLPCPPEWVITKEVGRWGPTEYPSGSVFPKSVPGKVSRGILRGEKDVRVVPSPVEPHVPGRDTRLSSPVSLPPGRGGLTPSRHRGTLSFLRFGPPSLPGLSPPVSVASVPVQDRGRARFIKSVKQGNRGR